MYTMNHPISKQVCNLGHWTMDMEIKFLEGDTYIPKILGEGGGCIKYATVIYAHYIKIEYYTVKKCNSNSSYLI